MAPVMAMGSVGGGPTSDLLAGAMQAVIEDTIAPAVRPGVMGRPAGQLLVLVSSTAPPSPLLVTAAPESTPGYARACALRTDEMGASTWMQATATTDAAGSRLALVMLGDNAWTW